MNFINFKKFFEWFLNIFCAIGFLCHTSILFREYMSGKTVVNVSVGRIQNQTLPAITICLPYYLSMSRASKYSSEFKKKFGTYFNLIRNFQKPMDKIENKTKLFREF